MQHRPPIDRNISFMHMKDLTIHELCLPLKILKIIMSRRNCYFKPLMPAWKKGRHPQCAPGCSIDHDQYFLIWDKTLSEHQHRALIETENSKYSGKMLQWLAHANIFVLILTCVYKQLHWLLIYHSYPLWSMEMTTEMRMDQVWATEYEFQIGNCKCFDMICITFSWLHDSYSMYVLQQGLRHFQVTVGILDALSD